jgi:low-affinity ferrous iron transport protein
VFIDVFIHSYTLESEYIKCTCSVLLHITRKRLLELDIYEEMERFIRLICAPGAKGAIEGTAPTQTMSDDNEIHYKPSVKARLLDRWLDNIVEFSGSEYMFFLLIGGLLSWAFMGIRFGTSDDWQILISDVQAIVSYLFDSLLMRQQLREHERNLEVAACLRSRCVSNKRMLKKIIESDKNPQTLEPFKPLEQSSRVPFNNPFGQGFEGSVEGSFGLPSENWFGRICTRVSFFLGHIIVVFMFWVGIFIWIGFGPSLNWDNSWQLYMNSASSALMVLLFSFLANIRERHSRYHRMCIDLIYQTDSALELKLRILSEDTISNQPIIIPPPKVSKVQRAINYYADLIGTLIGIAILVIVLIVWIVIGPAMSFSSNWWLLIGTYSGLIGMNDGFVLRNIYHFLRIHEDVQFEEVRLDDLELFPSLPLEDQKVVKKSISARISLAVGKFCSHEFTVLLGAGTMIGLIIISSAMRWSLTGQLISNVPPSIIESFFMMILITGHNEVEVQRRIELNNIYTRRLKLISYVDALCCKEKEKQMMLVDEGF